MEEGAASHGDDAETSPKEGGDETRQTSPARSRLTVGQAAGALPKGEGFNAAGWEKRAERAVSAIESGARVKANVKAQLIMAGYGDDAADASAKIFASHVMRSAQRLEMSPEEYFKVYANVKFVRGEAAKDAFSEDDDVLTDLFAERDEISDAAMTTEEEWAWIEAEDEAAKAAREAPTSRENTIKWIKANGKQICGFSCLALRLPNGCFQVSFLFKRASVFALVLSNSDNPNIMGNIYAQIEKSPRMRGSDAVLRFVELKIMVGDIGFEPTTSTV